MLALLALAAPAAVQGQVEPQPTIRDAVLADVVSTQDMNFLIADNVSTIELEILNVSPLVGDALNNVGLFVFDVSQVYRRRWETIIPTLMTIGANSLTSTIGNRMTATQARRRRSTMMYPLNSNLVTITSREFRRRPHLAFAAATHVALT